MKHLLNNSRSRILTLIIILGFISESLTQEDDKIIDYAKLELDKNKLYGSRWALEKKGLIKVYHAFEITEIVKVDTDGMSIRVEFFVHQRWEALALDLPPGLFLANDSNGTFIVADEAVLSTVWSPDSFIPNARETKIHSATTIQSVVNLYKNKTIVYKARMYSLLGCEFNFKWYPLDIQVCPLIFESYRFNSKDVVYEWEPDRPVTVSPDITLYQYELKLPPTKNRGNHTRWGGKYHYPFVSVIFKFERKLGNNILQIFVPTFLVVTLSWFSFWLGLDAVPGRISLLVTCILTLVTMLGGLKGIIPPVHYVKMMDIWMVGCMTFVFGAICEFIIVKYMSWRNQQKQKAKEDMEKFMKKPDIVKEYLPQHIYPNGHGHVNPVPMPNVVYPPDYKQPHHPYIDYYKDNESGNLHHRHQSVEQSILQQQAWERQHAFRSSAPPDFNEERHNISHPIPGDYPGMIRMHEMQMRRHEQHSKPTPPKTPTWIKIERVCRVLFPLLFAAFNAAYWPILLIGSAKQHDDV